MSRRTSGPLLILLALAGLSLSGCGGSDGDSGGTPNPNPNPNPNPAPETISGATFRIVWPARSRAAIETGLSSARSARIVFPKAASDGSDVSVNVDRDAAQLAGYTGTYTIPTAILKTTGFFTASFFADTGESGSTVGSAAGTLNLSGTGLEAGTVVVAGTVRNVAVIPPPTLTVGDAPVQLYVTATDASGTAVALSAGSIVWRLTSGNDRVSLTGAGVLTAVAAGTATLVASLDGVTTAPATARVVPLITTPVTQVLPLTANGLAYDRTRNRIWAATPGGSAGTGLVEIDPASGEIGRTISMDQEPEKVAVTDDGQFAYVSVEADGTVRCFDLATGVQVTTTNVGRGGASADLVTLPGQPRSFVAVADPNGGVNTVVYDDGVARAGRGASGITAQVADANTIYGEGRDGSTIFTNRLTPASIAFTDQTNVDSRSIRYADGFLYTSNGSIVDAATLGIVGRFPTTSLLVDRLAAVSSSDDRVYVNTWNPSTPKRIVVWDRTSRTELLAYDTGFQPGGTENFIACGNHTVAFNAFGISVEKSIVLVRNLP